MNNITKTALINSLLTALYVALVGTFMHFTPVIFAGVNDKSILIPIMMLLLFLVSASITGSLVLGKPILWYLDGKKKEALELFICTVGCLFVVGVVVFLLLLIQ